MVPEGLLQAAPEKPEGEYFEHIKKATEEGRHLSIPQAYSEILGIPHLKERSSEKVVAERHEGKWIQPDQGCRYWDSGKDYSKDNYADVIGNVEEALQQIGRPLAIWGHNRSLCLVILDEKHKVGVRSVDLRVPYLGMLWSNAEALLQGLKQRLVTH